MFKCQKNSAKIHIYIRNIYTKVGINFKIQPGRHYAATCLRLRVGVVRVGLGLDVCRVRGMVRVTIYNCDVTSGIVKLLRKLPLLVFNISKFTDLVTLAS